MNFKETLTVLNEMQSQGVVASYALGGAVAASLYLEVAPTEDIDVFVVLKLSPGSTLISLSPIYDYLMARGYEMQGEYVVISGWPVQFLAPDSPLVEEALEQAVVKDIDGIPVRTFTAEHVIAIALNLGRPKDKARLVQFLEASNSSEARIKFDESIFNAILERHGLIERWTETKRQLVR